MEQDRLDKLEKLNYLLVGKEKVPINQDRQYNETFEVYSSLSLAKEVISKLKSWDLKIIEGRVVQINNLGKCMFIQIQTNKGLKQIFAEQSLDSFEVVKLVQIGDLVRASGVLFLTKQEKECLYTCIFILCAKALRGIGKSLKEDGKIENAETLRRQRYIDYISNGTESLRVRHKVINKIRECLNNSDYVEVETRILQPINSGANARPFVTKYNVVGEDFFLRVAPELDLKRLVIGGLYRVYEIGKSFRNEGISDKHNPEFTSLEVYTAFSNWEDAISMSINLLSWAFIAAGKPELLQTHVNIEDLLKEHGVSYTYETIMEQFEKEVEPKLASLYKDRLVIVDGFPTYSCALAKTFDKDPKYIERFEMYFNGMEIANGYSELNNSIEQRKRFEEQQLQKDKMDIDEDFLNALEYGMPPTSGFGIGIDRLMMILLEKDNIKDVIPFPPYKNK